MTASTYIADYKGVPVVSKKKEELRWYWINTTGSFGAVAVHKDSNKIVHSMGHLLAWTKGREFEDVIYFLEENKTFINYMRVR